MTLGNADTTTFYFDRNMEKAERCAFASGNAVVLTRRCPQHETANEDAAMVTALDPESGVLAVADGMGGLPAGARAACVALESLAGAVHRSLIEQAELRDVVLNGFEDANHAVLELGVGAGTTLAAVQVQGDRIRPYHVGDSMILVVGQRGHIRLQSVPHSPVGYAMEAGVLDSVEAMNHEDRHLVSNMIGTPEMRIEIGAWLKLKPRDTLLIASDGLSDNLHVEEIVDLIRAGPLETGVNRLAEACAKRMEGTDAGNPTKPDDLTAIAYRMG